MTHHFHHPEYTVYGVYNLQYQLHAELRSQSQNVGAGDDTRANFLNCCLGSVDYFKSV